MVPPGAAVPCDCVLLQGEVVVNEAALTGESVPCRKVPWAEAGVDPATFCADRDRSCVLFAGTIVLQVIGARAAVGMALVAGVWWRLSLSGRPQQVNTHAVLHDHAVPSSCKQWLCECCSHCVDHRCAHRWRQRQPY